MVTVWSRLVSCGPQRFPNRSWRPYFYGARSRRGLSCAFRRRRACVSNRIAERTPRRRRVSMRTRPRGVAITIGIAALATIASACGGGSSGGNPNTQHTQNPADLGFQKVALNNEGAGAPVKGGTLNVLSSTDTDYLDANVTYYSAGYAYIREIVRGLYNYPATPGHTTDVVPDIATAAPEVSSDGLTYTITLKKGVFWNTTPKREITAADVVRGIKVACNPVQPFGGLPDFDFLIEG